MTDNDWLERAWEHREEQLYPALFGNQSRGIFCPDASAFTGRFKQESIDPRWLTHGIFEFAPTPARNSWLYVTSGMSNDWDADAPDPATVTGLGCEFVFEIPFQSDMAIRRLTDIMIFQILICYGRFPQKDRPLMEFDRIPLRSPILDGPSVLTTVMLANPTHFARVAQLDTGSFQFFQIVGISEAEAAYARANGGPALMDLLIKNNDFPVTDPGRKELELPGTPLA